MDIKSRGPGVPSYATETMSMKSTEATRSTSMPSERRKNSIL